MTDLDKFLDLVRQCMQKIENARAEAIEEAAKVAESFIPTGPSPIGPLHRAGIADAAKAIAVAIRALKPAATPSEST